MDLVFEGESVWQVVVGLGVEVFLVGIVLDEGGLIEYRELGMDLRGEVGYKGVEGCLWSVRFGGVGLY